MFHVFCIREVHAALAKSDTRWPRTDEESLTAEAELVFESMDADGAGGIRYDEFLAATLSRYPRRAGGWNAALPA